MERFMIVFMNNLPIYIVMSVMLVKILKLKTNTNQFICLLTLMNSFTSGIVYSCHLAGFIQIFFSQLITYELLKKYDEQFSIYDMLVSLFMTALLFLSLFISIIIVSIMFDIHIKDITINSQAYLSMTMIGLALFIMTCRYTSSYQLKQRMKILNSKLGYFLIVEFFFLLLFIGEYIVSFMLKGNILFEQGMMFVFIVLMFISFIYILNQYNAFYEDYINQKLLTQKAMIQKYNNNMIKNMKYEVDQMDHRMNYILQAVLNDIQNHDYQKAASLITSFKNEFNKMTHIVNTQNETFDLLFNFQIQNIENSNNHIKTGIFISQNDFYNDSIFCNFFITLLQMSNQHFHNIELFMSESHQILEIKLILQECDTQLEMVQLIYETFLSSIEYKSSCFVEQDRLFIMIKINQG